MEKKMNITQVRDELGALVDEVQYGDSKYIITRHGKPAAAVVPLYVYENWQSSRDRLFGLIEQMQTSSGSADPDEIMALVLEAQEAVRSGNSEE